MPIRSHLWLSWQLYNGKNGISTFSCLFSIRYFCIGICYAKLFEAAKIHVQIMRFTCCLNTAYLTKSVWALICLHDVTGKVFRPWLFILPMLLFAKTLRASMTLWRRYDVRKFDTDANLFREILCKKTDILMFKGRLQWSLCWNQVKCARITITHLWYTALTLAGSLGRCLNTGPSVQTASSGPGEC